uniref:hypothetical protein n=1 Tax=uncultured Allobacillus sp. TaxID=1638025 RepID=UPI002595A2FD|nr:hypothetical protein [uncultured Allobacillus sp.]
MSTPLLLMLITIFILSAIVVYQTIYNRNKIKIMTGMMLAMSIGMSVGLFAGVISGILFENNFFIATIVGMVIGMSTGFIAGIPISIIAVLDGFLAGLMGGMMGAMLGAMIAIEYQEPIVKLMFYLFLSTLLMILYVIKKETNKEVPSFYTNPFILIILYSLLFILFHQADPMFNQFDSCNHNH